MMKNRDLRQFDFQQKAGLRHPIDVYHLSQEHYLNATMGSTCKEVMNRAIFAREFGVFFYHNA